MNDKCKLLIQPFSSEMMIFRSLNKTGRHNNRHLRVVRLLQQKRSSILDVLCGSVHFHANTSAVSSLILRTTTYSVFYLGHVCVSN
jgi:hypothetical protein